MKKIIFIIFIFTFTILLSSCGSSNSENKTTTTQSNMTTTTNTDITTTAETISLTDAVMVQKINELINAQSWETKYSFSAVTDEMEISINPLLSVKKYTDNDGSLVYAAHYYNKVLEGVGFEPLDFIIDNHYQAVYINTGTGWYTNTFAELENEIDFPLFDLMFDYGDQIDADVQTILDDVTTLFIDGLADFTDATYIETINDGTRELNHYELTYNVYDLAESIFDYFNANEHFEIDFDDFDAFIDDLNIQDVADLFKTFEIQVYFDDSNDDIGRIELNFMDMLNNSVIIDQLNDEIKSTSVDVGFFFDYVSEFKLTVNIFDINTLAPIVVPDLAKSGFPIGLIGAPFDPNTIETLPLDTDKSLSLEYNDDNHYYYSFSLNEETSININYTEGFLGYFNLRDSQYNYIDYINNSSNTINYSNLPAGIYYVEVYSIDNRGLVFNIETLD